MTVTEHTDPDTQPGRPPYDGPLPVDGVLPSDLHGTFVQTGPHPGTSRRPEATTQDLVCGIRFGDGLARRLRVTAEDAGAGSLGQAPGREVWNRSAVPTPDGPSRARFAPPVRERGGSRWHTIATYPGLDTAEHLSIGPDGHVTATRAFPLDGAPLMHALALTDRYVVVFDLPVTYNRAAALLGARLPYRWRDDRVARIGLLPRRPDDAARPRWFPIAPCFVSGAVNAFDALDGVIVDAVRHERAFTTTSSGTASSHAWLPGRVGETGASGVHRWTLDLASGTARERLLAASLTAASVDSRRIGRRHQLLFGSAADGRAIIARDLAAETTQVLRLDGDRRAGQPVFVPRGVAEGHGWLMVVVRDPVRRRAELLVLDALDLTGRPQAVVHLPDVPPEARHTSWVEVPHG